MEGTGSGQARDSAAQNAEFFAGDTYARQVDRLDSYEFIRARLNRELEGTKRLLDVGNGGVFEYDTAVAEEIVAVDLFLDEASTQAHENVIFRRGDALVLPESSDSFDVVLEAYLFHHLTGELASDSVENVRTALAEARRVLIPGGRVVIAESCVPMWFYRIERTLFRPLRWVAKTPLLRGHPAVLQLPVQLIENLVAEQFVLERSEQIQLGRWISQFGRNWPTLLTPVTSHLITGRKSR